MDPQVFIFMGGSGSGKGTQARLLKEYLEKEDSRKVLYFETGRAFREFADKDGYTAEILEEYMDSGGLVPVFLPIWIWTNFIVQNYTGEEHLIFDGLARREIEAPIMDSAMEFYGIEHINIIYLKTSREWSKERLLERGREDDKEEEIENRLDWFSENAMKAIDYFKEYESGTFHEIDGEQTIEKVHQDVLKELEI